MRSRSTNVLQGVVLLTGVVYIVIGLFFYISPFKALRLFATTSKGAVIADHSENVRMQEIDKDEGIPEEEWLKQTINDEIISPLYYIFRIFSLLLFVSGIAMVMPLFDPLKYRGLIYYNGLIFSFISALSIIFFIRSHSSINIEIASKAGKGNQAMSWYDGHLIMMILGIIFATVFVLNALSLTITKKQTREGLE